MILHDVELEPQAIRAYCEKWRIRSLSVFGSILRADFRPDSDVDVLIDFAPGVRWSLLDFVRAEQELSDLLGRQVELVERRAVEKSDNHFRRDDVLKSAEPIYVAR